MNGKWIYRMHGYMQDRWVDEADNRRWARTAFVPEDQMTNRLSLHRQNDHEFYVFDDPGGMTPFSKSRALSGPFETLEGAKVAYLIRMQVK